MTAKQRLEIETRLANYNIPIQILESIAERCNCTLYGTVSRKDLQKKPKILTLLARLNDDALMLLEQIFLECHDSFSNLRFGVLLSSTYNPMQHKFVFGERIAGESGIEYSIDISIHGRSTQNLVAVGFQNNDESQHAADDKSVNNFLATIKDLRFLHPNLRGAYYSSSYGYQIDNKLGHLIRRWHQDVDNNERIDVRFFDYRNRIYYEIKSQ